MVTTHSSWGIKSSMSTSPLTVAISVRRSSENLRFISRASSLTMASRRPSLARMALKSAMWAWSSSSSFSIFKISSPASWPSWNLQMASACKSSKPKRSISAALASGRPPLQARMVAMISSTMSMAFFKPSKMWARSWAFFRSNWVRRVMTSIWNWMYSSRICRRFNSLGSPFTMASIITPKVVCIWVKLNRWFKTIWGEASRFTSMTMCMPLRSEWSSMLEMPSMRFSFTRSAMLSIRRALFTW